MSDLSIVVSPGITLSGSYTIAELNKLGLPTIQLTGTVGTANISDGAISPIKVSQGAYFYGVDAGSTDAYAVTFAPAVTAYADGMILAVKAKTKNTGPATLNANGLGAIAIKKFGGTRDLDDNDIPALTIFQVRYNAGDAVGPPIIAPYFQILSLLGNPPRDFVQVPASAFGRGLGGITADPVAGQQTYFWRGDSTWVDITSQIDARVTVGIGTTLALFQLQNFK